MNIFAIVDSDDTRIGLRLAGISGITLHTAGDVERELSRAALDKDMGILVITAPLAALCPDTIKDIKLNRRMPLVVEIPGRNGDGRPADFISAYIRQAIGIKLN